MRVLVAATEWSSGRGGLSTFNRSFCVALTRCGAEVVCVTLDRPGGDYDVLDGVTVVGAQELPGGGDMARLARPPLVPRGFVPDAVIGHGRVTGPAALSLREDHFSASCGVHFIHVAPDEIEVHKHSAEDADLRAETRTLTERLLAQRADVPVAVGPRLRRRYSRDLAYGGGRLLEFIPGCDTHDAVDVTGDPLILIFGRAEDHHLKGLDIAAAAVGRASALLPGSRLELVVRGAPSGQQAQLRQMLEPLLGPHANLVIRRYTTDQGELEHDIRTSSVVLMPSRAEGFGLTGLESIGFGVPTLMTDQSGLAELCIGVSELARSFVLSPGPDAASIWAECIAALLRDRPSAKATTLVLRDKLRAKSSWDSEAKKVLDEIEETMKRKKARSPGAIAGNISQSEIATTKLPEVVRRKIIILIRGRLPDSNDSRALFYFSTSWGANLFYNTQFEEDVEERCFRSLLNVFDLPSDRVTLLMDESFEFETQKRSNDPVEPNRGIINYRYQVVPAVVDGLPLATAFLAGFLGGDGYRYRLLSIAEMRDRDSIETAVNGGEMLEISNRFGVGLSAIPLSILG